MKNLKRHWMPMAAVLALLVLAGSFWIRNGDTKIVLAQAGGGSGYAAADEAERQTVARLLDDLSLDREALIALNLSATQAESVLATTRTWRADNAAALAALRDTITHKVYALRQLHAAIRKGPVQQGRDAAVATASQKLARARAAYTAALRPLEVSINALLSDSQKATWTAIGGGFDRDMPLGMLALTPDQRRAVSRCERHYRWRQGAARTAEERDAAVAARRAELEQTLTPDQLQVIDAYGSYYTAASQTVAEAFSTVLPPA